MGTLYRNGIPYVGSGGAGGVEVTQAEYDALPTSEKMNGSIYFITDGSVSYPTASQMRYDNTESGIPSTSVQGAIDELKIEIGDTDISSIGDGTLSGAVDALNNGLAQSSVLETLAYTDVTATRTTLTLIGDRKLSDYKIVVLCAFDGLQLVNGSTLINRSSFTSGYSMYVHGYSLINYNGSALCRYVNDTTVSMEAVELNGWTSMRCILYGLR